MTPLRTGIPCVLTLFSSLFLHPATFVSHDFNKLDATIGMLLTRPACR